MGVAGSGLEQFGMAIIAAEHPEMKGMAERDRPKVRDLDLHVLHRMTFGTLVQAERLDLVMAVAAGLPFLHLRHGDRRILFADNENTVMAESAVITELSQVGFMGERDFADLLSFYDRIFVVLGKQKEWQPKHHDRRHQETFHTVLLEAT
jgi:hypothetical protein